MVRLFTLLNSRRFVNTSILLIAHIHFEIVGWAARYLACKKSCTGKKEPLVLTGANSGLITRSDLLKITKAESRIVSTAK